MVPFDKLISYLNYKCETVGILVIENEESYTSKCDALTLENICKHDNYKGKRVKRGLFQSSKGRMRKVVGDSYARKIIDSGRLFRPIKLDDLYSLR
jgi:hypothetical protein